MCKSADPHSFFTSVSPSVSSTWETISLCTPACSFSLEIVPRLISSVTAHSMLYSAECSVSVKFRCRAVLPRRSSDSFHHVLFITITASICFSSTLDSCINFTLFHCKSVLKQLSHNWCCLQASLQPSLIPHPSSGFFYYKVLHFFDFPVFFPSDDPHKTGNLYLEGKFFLPMYAAARYILVLQGLPSHFGSLPGFKFKSVYLNRSGSHRLSSLKDSFLMVHVRSPRLRSPKFLYGFHMLPPFLLLALVMSEVLTFSTLINVPLTIHFVNRALTGHTIKDFTGAGLNGAPFFRPQILGSDCFKDDVFSTFWDYAVFVCEFWGLGCFEMMHFLLWGSTLPTNQQLAGATGFFPTSSDWGASRLYVFCLPGRGWGSLGGNQAERRDSNSFENLM